MCDTNEIAAVLFNSIQAGIIVVDADTKKIIDINAAAAILLGVSIEDIRGKTCREYLCIDDCNGCPVMTSRIEEGLEDVENKEVILYRKDGSQVHALLTITSRFVNNRRLFVNTIIDITKTKEMEYQLNEYWDKAGELLENNLSHLKNFKNRG